MMCITGPTTNKLSKVRMVYVNFVNDLIDRTDIKPSKLNIYKNQI